MNYYFEVHPEPEGGYSITFPDLPGVITEGDTIEECRRNAEEALNGYLEVSISHGLLPNQPIFIGTLEHEIEVAPHIVIAIELRKIRGNISQAVIASKLGIPYQSYQRLENPVKGNPTIKTLEKVACVLGKRLQVNFV
jgi:antitoxin HicB